jgi:hypothetical protein
MPFVIAIYVIELSGKQKTPLTFDKQGFKKLSLNLYLLTLNPTELPKDLVALYARVGLSRDVRPRPRRMRQIARATIVCGHVMVVVSIQVII